jgi:hypothetical protein
MITAEAAEKVNGMASIGTNGHSLEDYFSAKAIGLLKHFCDSSNQNDLGSHTLDQRKWNAFLLCVYREEKEPVAGDVFKRLLESTKWWPQADIPRRGKEYDFAMRLLEQSAKT